MKCRYCGTHKQATYVMCSCASSVADRRARTQALTVKKAAQPKPAQALTRARRHGRAGS